MIAIAINNSDQSMDVLRTPRDAFTAFQILVIDYSDEHLLKIHYSLHNILYS